MSEPAGAEAPPLFLIEIEERGEREREHLKKKGCEKERTIQSLSSSLTCGSCLRAKGPRDSLQQLRRLSVLFGVKEEREGR